MFEICFYVNASTQLFFLSTFRVKIFRGRKVHGEFDIKVEQVDITGDGFLISPMKSIKTLRLGIHLQIFKVKLVF